MKYATVDKEWFERALAHRGLSVRGLAREMGIDASAMSRALNSQRKLKPEEIQRLSEILGQPVVAILGHVNAGAQSRPKGFEEMQQVTFGTETPPSAKRHPLFGIMKGTSIIMPGVDLTQPADPEWGDVDDAGAATGQAGDESK